MDIPIAPLFPIIPPTPHITISDSISKNMQLTKILHPIYENKDLWIYIIKCIAFLVLAINFT